MIICSTVRWAGNKAREPIGTVIKELSPTIPFTNRDRPWPQEFRTSWSPSTDPTPSNRAIDVAAEMAKSAGGSLTIVSAATPLTEAQQAALKRIEREPC